MSDEFGFLDEEKAFELPCRLIFQIARALVDDPDQIQVEAIREDFGVTLRLYVARSDVGKMIGKQGRTARALRTILSGVGIQTGYRIVIDILEPTSLSSEAESRSVSPIDPGLALAK